MKAACSRHHIVRRMSNRPAFTLAEVLVAVVVFSVGILGLAATGSFLVVQVRDAQAFTHAATLAGNVLDSLRATPCSAVAGGSRSLGGATVGWTAAPGARVVAVTAMLTIPRRRPPWQMTIDALLPCDR
jgi:prepilin-type N-terminal cleavage/methylation domain-containing protein